MEFKIASLGIEELAAITALSKVESDSSDNLFRQMTRTHKCAVVFKRDPATIEQEVGAGAQQQAVAAIRAFISIFALRPRFDMTCSEKSKVCYAGHTALLLDSEKAAFEKCLF